MVSVPHSFPLQLLQSTAQSKAAPDNYKDLILKHFHMVPFESCCFPEINEGGSSLFFLLSHCGRGRSVLFIIIIDIHAFNSVNIDNLDISGGLILQNNIIDSYTD